LLRPRGPGWRSREASGSAPEMITFFNTAGAMVYRD
jgi:hypothetical protein